jgi:hypothetical protein
LDKLIQNATQEVPIIGADGRSRTDLLPNGKLFVIGKSLLSTEHALAFSTTILYGVRERLSAVGATRGIPSWT